MSQALGCLRPHEPEGMLRGIRRVTVRWSSAHAQVPYHTLPEREGGGHGNLGAGPLSMGCRHCRRWGSWWPLLYFLELLSHFDTPPSEFAPFQLHFVTVTL